MNCEKSYDSLPNFTAADCKCSPCLSRDSLFASVADCSCTITRPQATGDTAEELSSTELLCLEVKVNVLIKAFYYKL